jgi:hypothetical protein
MSESQPPKLQHFRKILFWPLRLIRPDDKTNWEKEGCVAYIQQQVIPMSSPWIPANKNLYNRGTAADEITCYAELVYFHPFIRRFLYGEPGSERTVLQIFKRTDVKKMHIVLREGQTLDFNVDRVHLYVFDIEVAILVLEISSQNLADTKLSDIQDFLDQFRRVYPPYWDEVADGTYKAGHSPQTVTFLGKNNKGENQELINGTFNHPKEFLPFVRHNKVSPVAKHWCFLLEPFVPYECADWDKDKVRYQQIEDERIPHMAYLAFDDPRLLTKGDMMRLGLADSSGDKDTFPYSSQFAKNFERDYCFDLFWETNPQYQEKHGWMNTRYICCGYAFTMIGQFYVSEEGEPGFFNDSKVGALAHFRHHYFQMGLIVHFHKVALLMLWDDLAQATATFKGKQYLPQFHDEIGTILERLLSFTNRDWFTELSNQFQSKQLFDMWSRHLGNRELVDRVLKEAQDVYQYLEMEEQKHHTKSIFRLTVVATTGLVFALTFEFFGADLNAIFGLESVDLGKVTIVLVVFAFIISLPYFLDKLSIRIWKKFKSLFQKTKKGK